MKKKANAELTRNIVVIGASAGGVEALKALFSMIPPNIQAAFFVVLHTPPQGQSFLPELITKAGAMVAQHATDNMALLPGQVYVAPPDFHMILKAGVIRLTRGAKENRHRPAIDPLFRSAALEYGPRVIGVILSGTLDDGTSGLAAIKRQGGMTMVQDPAEALFAGMPLSAMRHVDVDHALPIELLAKTLIAVCGQPVSGSTESTHQLGLEMNIGTSYGDGVDLLNQLGKPSVFTCPECHGALWEIRERDLLRFRCHVGHAFSAETLAAELNTSAEATMWSSVRSLEDAANLARMQEARARKQGDLKLAAIFEQQRKNAEHHAVLLRDALIITRTATED